MSEIEIVEKSARDCVGKKMLSKSPGCVPVRFEMYNVRREKNVVKVIVKHLGYEFELVIECGGDGISRIKIPRRSRSVLSGYPSVEFSQSLWEYIVRNLAYNGWL